jgi:hypothetical protein
MLVLDVCMKSFLPDVRFLPGTGNPVAGDVEMMEDMPFKASMRKPGVGTSLLYGLLP